MSCFVAVLLLYNQPSFLFFFFCLCPYLCICFFLGLGVANSGSLVRGNFFFPLTCSSLAQSSVIASFFFFLLFVPHNIWTVCLHVSLFLSLDSNLSLDATVVNWISFSCPPPLITCALLLNLIFHLLTRSSFEAAGGLLLSFILDEHSLSCTMYNIRFTHYALEDVFLEKLHSGRGKHSIKNVTWCS